MKVQMIEENVDVAINTELYGIISIEYRHIRKLVEKVRRQRKRSAEFKSSMQICAVSRVVKTGRILSGACEADIPKAIDKLLTKLEGHRDKEGVVVLSDRAYKAKDIIYNHMQANNMTNQIERFDKIDMVIGGIK